MKFLEVLLEPFTPNGLGQRCAAADCHARLGTETNFISGPRLPVARILRLKRSPNGPLRPKIPHRNTLFHIFSPYFPSSMARISSGQRMNVTRQQDLLKETKASPGKLLRSALCQAPGASGLEAWRHLHAPRRARRGARALSAALRALRASLAKEKPRRGRRGGQGHQKRRPRSPLRASHDGRAHAADVALTAVRLPTLRTAGRPRRGQIIARSV